jgi:hypothetical protein
MLRTPKQIVLWLLVGINIVVISMGLGLFNFKVSLQAFQNLGQFFRTILLLAGTSFIISGGVLGIFGGIIFLISRSRQTAVYVVRYGFSAWVNCGLISLIVVPIALPMIDASVYPPSRVNDSSRIALYIVLLALWQLFMAGATFVGLILGSVRAVKIRR